MIARNLAASLRYLALPFKLLRIGHVRVAAYTLAIGAIAVVTAYQLYQLFQGRLEIVRGLSDLEREILRFSAVVAISTVSIPLLFVAAIVPVRTIWISEKRLLGRMIRATPGAVRDFCRTIAIALFRSFHLLLPILGVALIYAVMKSHVTSPAAWWAFALVAAPLALMALYRSAPLLLAPTLTVCAEIAPLAAVLDVSRALGCRMFQLYAITLTALAASLALRRSAGGSPTPWELGAHAAIVWYTLTLLSITVMIAITPPPSQPQPTHPPEGPQQPPMGLPPQGGRKMDSRRKALGF